MGSPGKAATPERSSERDPERDGGARALLRGALLGLTGLGFLGLMGGGIAALHFRAAAEPATPANPPVSVAVRQIRLDDGYDVTERFAGRLEPARETHLAFERAGLVLAVLFEEGDRVERGEVVARLDTAKLEAERDRLRAQRRELQAQEALARATLKRQETLATKGWQTEQRYDEARFGLAETAAAIERIDAAIASVEVDIGKSVLTAPFAGSVAARSVDEGAVVAAGAPVVELLESGARQLRVGVSVEAAEALEAGRLYRLDADGRRLEGRLIAKRPDLQTGTRTVTALLEVTGGEAVPFGEIVELLLERRVPSVGAWLPLTALSEGRKGLWSLLTVVERDGVPTVAREAVEILHLDGARAFVRGTIGEGAKVVLDGTNRIIPGQRVALAVGE